MEIVSEEAFENRVISRKLLEPMARQAAQSTPQHCRDLATAMRIIAVEAEDEGDTDSADKFRLAADRYEEAAIAADAILGLTEDERKLYLKRQDEGGSLRSRGCGEPD